MSDELEAWTCNKCGKGFHGCQCGKAGDVMDRGDQPFADLAAGINAVVCAACAAKDQRVAALEAQRDELAGALRRLKSKAKGFTCFPWKEFEEAEAALAKVPKKGG